MLFRILEKFREENLKNHLNKWKSVTSDKIIPDIIENGLKLGLIDTPKLIPSLYSYPHMKRN